MHFPVTLPIKLVFRGYKIYLRNNNSLFHPSVITTIHNTITALIVGGLYGGATTSRTTFISFIENNEATQFISQHDAKRRLSDKMFTSFMQGFTRTGLKVAVFCGALSATYTIISVYNNKDSVMYYTAAGSVAGALYKFPLGSKGMIAGMFFGGCFGSILGAFKWVTFKITNYSEEQLRLLTAERAAAREEAIVAGMKYKSEKKMEKELVEAMRHY
ncbi:RPII140-upstream gene protein isoform X2 [Copidosoma floridanum]|uniref:RPII140-upstream gene protein isoform X2 n=1 Tax=Copidosoma floridanum TaxID=29053 RepID=UPI0006C94644|nr:RPII140-upstream gene protein isoform X2 [Copidosoma floridanum]